MKKTFSLALIAQTIFSILFVIHRFFKPLGSDLMFGVLILSIFAGIFLLWQSFSNKLIVDTQKKWGILMGFLPIIWILLLFLFVNTSKM
jgi:hypothetical protein